MEMWTRQLIYHGADIPNAVAPPNREPTLERLTVRTAEFLGHVRAGRLKQASIFLAEVVDFSDETGQTGRNLLMQNLQRIALDRWRVLDVGLIHDGYLVADGTTYQIGTCRVRMVIQKDNPVTSESDVTLYWLNDDGEWFLAAPELPLSN